MCNCSETNIEKISKGWEIASRYSEERLRKVYDLDEGQLKDAINEGRLVLETLCLFVHACVKSGQYRLPAEFWRLMHVEYGIVVYPSAFTDEIDRTGLGVDKTFTQAYSGHIVMYQNCIGRSSPMPCPFHLFQEPPPAYKK